MHSEKPRLSGAAFATSGLEQGGSLRHERIVFNGGPLSRPTTEQDVSIRIDNFKSA